MFFESAPNPAVKQLLQGVLTLHVDGFKQLLLST